MESKYNCILCKYETSYPSEWIKHTKTKKHERLGKPKSSKCDKCCRGVIYPST